ncbi:PAS domain-containing protein [Cereibacter sphaeroides]|nr:PAS domain-containing protein [Cereibacter sphaeroides]
MTQVSQTNSYANAPRDAGQEMPFDLRELIYSRTDDRGVIQAANDVFGRLAGYTFREFIGAPHKLIRHPDMPKGFFHIFWQYLKAGEPAVGYVKNRSKDGRYYWVLAAAIPCDGGYFSVRMKPNSNLFHTIRAEYANLRRREEKEDLSAEASAEILLERLNELGFYSYPEFMSQALQEESAARDAGLGRPADKVAAHLTGLVTALTDALKEQTRLVGLFDSLKLLPVNMRLIAARLEPQGGPISQISMNYKTSFDNISERLTKFVTGEANICGRMDTAVRRGLILTNCARLHLEMSSHIRRPESGAEGSERRKEHLIVEKLGSDSQKRVQASLADAANLAASLIAAAFEIRRLVLGLDTIRILGRVESRRDHVFEAACSATLDQIDSVQAEISESLQSLSNLAVQIQTSLSMINATRAKAESAQAAQAAAEAEAAGDDGIEHGFMSGDPSDAADMGLSAENDSSDGAPRYAAE